MLYQNKSLILEESRKLITFGAIGGLGAFINTAILYLMTSYVGLHYILASLIATETAIISNFFLNNHFTFKQQSVDVPVHKKFLSFQIVSIISLLGTIAILWYLTSSFGKELLLLWNLIAIFIMFLLNFFLNRKFTWKREV